MALNLPAPLTPANLTQQSATWKRILEQADQNYFKKGQDVIVSPARLILTDPTGGTWSVTVSASGVLSATAVTLPATRGTSGT